MNYCSSTMVLQSVNLAVNLQNGNANRIVLQKPIFITANEDYEIEITLKRNWSYQRFYVPAKLSFDLGVISGDARGGDDVKIKFKKSLNSTFDSTENSLISALFFKLHS